VNAMSGSGQERLEGNMGDEYLGEDIPKLGFGFMRLPKVDGIKENPIDVE